MSKLKIAGGALIVGGTAIGAGMLALPVATAEGGFFPAILIYIFCWLFSLATGLLFVEICNWMPADANIVSMSFHLLGKTGRFFAWILYLFLFYCLMVAYASGGGNFFTSLLGLSPAGGILLFTLLFGFMIYRGVKTVDRINRVLMVGLILSFLGFILLSSGVVDTSKLWRANWVKSWWALPIMFTSFSYQGTIPSLYTYLERDHRQVRLAVIWGTLLPLTVYIVWELLILGVIPVEGANGLLEARAKGLSAIAPLKHFLTSRSVVLLGQFFAFFALTTSFLGVSLGLFDFLSDALQIAKEGVRRLLLSALVFVPPVIISMIYPDVFLRALGYAGGIGCVLLLGLLPVLMVWQGRYRKGYPRLSTELPGGKPLLCTLVVFIAVELAIEIASELH